MDIHHGLQTITIGQLPFLYIKFYWDTAMLIIYILSLAAFMIQWQS